MIRQIVPQFFTTDVAATVGYYRDQLGFELVGAWQDPPVYAILARDGNRIHLRLVDRTHAPPEKYAEELLDAYLLCEDADALHADLTARGVEFARDLGDTPWGVREFVVRDRDGRLLAFGSSASAG